jgi:hypothetical protein
MDPRGANVKTATRILLLSATAALFVALAATGCGRRSGQTPQAATPAQATQTVVTPSTPATPAAAGSFSTTGGVDAAGAAAGAPLTVGSASKSARGGIPRPADKTATSIAVSLLHGEGQIGRVRSISVRSMTQDKKGHWWVLIAIQDDMAGKNQVVLTYDGKGWDDAVFGEGVSNDDLPPDVRF